MFHRSSVSSRSRLLAVAPFVFSPWLFPEMFHDLQCPLCKKEKFKGHSYDCLIINLRPRPDAPDGRLRDRGASMESAINQSPQRHPILGWQRTSHVLRHWPSKNQSPETGGDEVLHAAQSQEDSSRGCASTRTIGGYRNFARDQFQQAFVRGMG